MTGQHDEAELALAALAAEVVNDLSNYRILELAAQGNAAKHDWHDLGPLALGAAEAANPEYRHGPAPDRAGKHHCDICGCAAADQIEPGPDAGTFGADKCAWMCKDQFARACEARKLHRYPPRADLLPGAVLSALGWADDANAARLAREQQQQQPAPQQQEHDQQQPGWFYPEGWQSTQYGTWTTNGTWLPPLPAYQAYAHTLMHPANRSHLLSGQQRPHYYGGHPGYAPPGVISGAQSAAELPGAAVPPAPPDGAQQAPGPVQGQEGGDRPQGQVPGVVPGRQQARPDDRPPPGAEQSAVDTWGRHGYDMGGGDPPAGASGGGPAARPPKPRRKSRGPQYGRRAGLRYSPEAAHGHGGGSGSYSGGETGAATGGSSET